MFFQNIILLIAFRFIAVKAAGGGGINFKITEAKTCMGNNLTITAIVDFKEDPANPDSQLMRVNATLKEPFASDDYNFLCKASRVTGSRQRVLITLAGKGPCKAVVNYGGELWTGYGVKAGIEKPTQCPFPKKNYFLDYTPISALEVMSRLGPMAAQATTIIKSLPKGIYTADCIMTDQNEKLVACLKARTYKG